MRLFHDLAALFYPRLCLACGLHLAPSQDTICTRCQFKLPKTGYHEQVDNPFTRKFWGRVDIQFGAAMYFFTKSGLVQPLLHQLKYKNKPEIGIKIGEMYGNLLRDNLYFGQIDCIVPVPMYPTKERTRGYNQAAMFGQGLAETMQKPQFANLLERTVNAASQTRKSNFERMDVLNNMYGVADTSIATGKHILLVDDVMTTGATIEACAIALLQLPDVKVSIATIAVATH
jgi:ComF family protein